MWQVSLGMWPSPFTLESVGVEEEEGEVGVEEEEGEVGVEEGEVGVEEEEEGEGEEEEGEEEEEGAGGMGTLCAMMTRTLLMSAT